MTNMTGSSQKGDSHPQTHTGMAVREHRGKAVLRQRMGLTLLLTKEYMKMWQPPTRSRKEAKKKARYRL